MMWSREPNKLLTYPILIPALWPFGVYGPSVTKKYGTMSRDFKGVPMYFNYLTFND